MYKKGAVGEREFSGRLNQILDRQDIERDISQCRAGGADITCLEGLSIEVKRCEVLSVGRWWEQVSRAADNAGTVPVLAYRQNRKAWVVCLPAGLLLPGLEGYIQLDLEQFAGWLRHFMGLEQG